MGFQAFMTINLGDGLAYICSLVSMEGSNPRVGLFILYEEVQGRFSNTVT